MILFNAMTFFHWIVISLIGSIVSKFIAIHAIEFPLYWNELCISLIGHHVFLTTIGNILLLPVWIQLKCERKVWIVIF